jgi:hypothetical protein
MSHYHEICISRFLLICGLMGCKGSLRYGVYRVCGCLVSQTRVREPNYVFRSIYKRLYYVASLRFLLSVPLLMCLGVVKCERCSAAFDWVCAQCHLPFRVFCDYYYTIGSSICTHKDFGSSRGRGRNCPDMSTCAQNMWWRIPA